MAKDGLRYASASDDVYWSEEAKQDAAKAGIKQFGITKEEIKQYVQEYVNATKKIISSGADGVEIHSAKSYILQQFSNVSSKNW